MDQPIVKIERLSHRYTTSWAIKDLNFELKNKGVYGLLGSNGAGKSTTMNILSGVLNQREGSVYINGVDLRKDPIQAKKHIGFLPQHPPLYLDLTVEEYLTYCAKLRSVKDDEVVLAVADVMKKCGLVHVKSRLLKNLSGGYRQRAGIAQAIVHKPALVVLDEPTNGLDPVQIVEVRNLIAAIGHEHTVLISSHLLYEIQLLCQQIIMIEQGKLVFCDSMEAFGNYIAPSSIYVELEKAPSAELLSAIRGVNRVERLNPRSFRIFYDGSPGVGEEIITQSVHQGWRMMQLIIEKKSIDEIFKQLTKNTRNN